MVSDPFFNLTPSSPAPYNLIEHRHLNLQETLGRTAHLAVTV